MTNLTEIISEILRLDQGATEKPWKATKAEKWEDKTITGFVNEAWSPFCGYALIEDAELIAYYRNEAPKIARAYEKLKEENEKLREEIEHYKIVCELKGL